MAQSLFTTQVPASQDATDGIVLMLGTYITPDVAGTVTALRFRFPETTQAAVKAALFRVSDQVKLSAATDPAFASPTLDDWNELTLASPVAVEAGVTYCAAARVLRYTSSGDALPVTNGDLSAASDAGHYSTFDPDGSVTFPNNASALCYFADLVFAAAETAEGATTLGIVLAVAASGGRASRGVAAPTLGLAVGVTGGRASRGATALGMNLAVSAAGAHDAEGSAALGLRFAVAARGSNGDAGRPVATFPWEPRPVRSFSEVME